MRCENHDVDDVTVERYRYTLGMIGITELQRDRYRCYSVITQVSATALPPDRYRCDSVISIADTYSVILIGIADTA